MDQIAPEPVAPLLAAFDAVATEGHVTRAASLLGVPQSSVSRRLRALERVIGVDLFQQAGRGVSLTSAGRDLHERTHELVRALDDAVAVVRGNADPDSGLVRFGFPLTLGPDTVATILREFHVDYPRIRVHVAQAHGDALTSMIRNGRLDVAVMIPPPDDLPSTVLRSQRIDVFVAHDHHLAGRSVVDMEELVDEPFVASPPEFHIRRLLDSWCAQAGFTPRVLFEFNEIDAIKALVAHGMGVALLPAESDVSGAVGVRLRGERSRDIGLATGHHRPTPAVERFREHLTTSI